MQESPEEAEQVFAKNVLSCLCRAIEFETDNYSGVRFANMVEDCNATVHAANTKRFPATARHDPKIADLRCDASTLEEWREVDVLGVIGEADGV